VSTAHELRLAEEGRRARLGAWYTPADVVDGVLDLALEPLLAARAAEGSHAVRALRVLDPTCGSGNFLLGAAHRVARCLVGLGVAEADARVAAVGCVAGSDIDPDAVELARTAVDGWAQRPSAARIVVADALTATEAKVGFDLVVGNPPFLGQLRRATRQDRAAGEAARRRFGDAVGAFTDGAALFWLLAGELARPDGGVVAMVLPTALLATRDGEPVRRRLLSGASVRDLWVAGEPVFEASVDVCAPVLVRHPTPVAQAAGPTRMWSGRDFRRRSDATPPVAASPTWSGLLATMAGLPEREPASAGRLGDLATATADFRDQYYGLAGHVVDRAEPADHGSEPALVTVGAVDPAHLRWGEVDTRFQRAAYRHPRVRVAELEKRLQAWAGERLVPKVLVATQTRVIEAVVDRDGALLPSVPLISLVPRSSDPHDLDRIAAVLTSPPVTLVAARRHLGTARHGDALKLRAADVLDLPLPVDRDRWDEAAAAFRAASEAPEPAERRRHLLACGRSMIEAFGLGEDPELHGWWTARLPRPPALGALTGR